MVVINMGNQDGLAISHGERILAALEGRWLSLKGLQGATGINYRTLESTVRRMVKNGKVRRLERGIYVVGVAIQDTRDISCPESDDQLLERLFYGVASEMSVCPECESAKAHLGAHGVREVVRNRVLNLEENICLNTCLVF